MNTTTMKVRAIAWTHFQPPADVPWATDATGGQALAEFAGRACYQSWAKPNPATATNAGHLHNILTVGHLSVLEHGTATLYFTGVSRAFTHELIRHRHLSYSQLSQRYVPDTGEVAEPDVIARDPYLHRVFMEACASTQAAYQELTHGLERKLANEPGTWEGCADPRNCTIPVEEHRTDPMQHRAPGARTRTLKAARQAARSILPNATETRIVVTGNYRAWRHFINLRATEHADVEIRAGAIAALSELVAVAPNVFADYTLRQLSDGTWVAASPFQDTL